MIAGDFKLTLKVKLTPNKENSGIQFRSEALPGRRGEGLPGRHRRRLVGQALRGARPRPACGRSRRDSTSSRTTGTTTRSSPSAARSRRGSTASCAWTSTIRRECNTLSLFDGGAMEVCFKELKLELMQPERK